MASKFKIRWTQSEWRKVADVYHAERTKGSNKGSAVQTANATLATERRRPIDAKSVLASISKVIERDFRPSIPAQQKSEEPLPPRAATPNDSGGFETLPAALLAVAHKVADEIAHEIFQSLKGRLQTLATDFIKQEALPRPRILVVGPIAHQQRLLEQEFGDVLDLRFVASNEPPRRVREIAPNCRKVLLWTNYINHVHQEVAYSTLTARRGDVHLVTGGVESVKNELMKFAVQ